MDSFGLYPKYEAKPHTTPARATDPAISARFGFSFEQINQTNHIATRTGGALVMTAGSLKNTWESIFRRKGGDGTYTRLFDSLEPGQRSALLSGLKLRETELPVIGSIRGPESWLLLTTERLVWASHGKRHELAADKIRDAVADFKQLQNSESKLDMRTLRVITLTGEEYTIELEPGQPLSGTWNVLKNLGTRNRHTTR